MVGILQLYASAAAARYPKY